MPHEPDADLFLPAMTGPAAAAVLLPAQLFHAADGTAYADIAMDGRRQCFRVQSKAFRQCVELACYNATGKSPSKSALKAWLDRVEAQAIHEAPEAEVHIRVAELDGRVFIDLADDGGRAVEISRDGWQVIDAAPVHFIRPPRMRLLPVPENGGSIEMLRGLVNVPNDDDFVLIVAWLLNALRNSGQHPPLVPSGSEGSAKTTFAAILSHLIDPNSMPLKSLPRTERELAAETRERYLQAFDNVSGMPRTISDALCRLSTGDDARPVMINGLDDVVKFADLADRCVFVTCDPISDERRRSEAQLWAEFEAVRARIFGLLLDGVSHGLRVLPETRLDRMPRMADFALFATACETKFWPSGTFMAAYNGNRADAVERLIEADVVASAVRSLAERTPDWKGTATKLKITLGPIFDGYGSAKLPVSARDLSVQLRKAATSLRKVGIRIEFGKTGHNRDREITITRDVLPPSAPSAPSAPPAAHQELAEGAPGTGTSSATTGPAEQAPASPTQAPRFRPTVAKSRGPLLRK